MQKSPKVKKLVASKVQNSPVHKKANAENSQKFLTPRKLHSDHSARSPISRKSDSNNMARSPISRKLDSNNSERSPIARKLDSNNSARSPKVKKLDSNNCQKSPVARTFIAKSSVVRKFNFNEKTQQENNGAKKYPCDFCTFVTHSSTSIKKHRARHTGEGMMTCSYCDYKTIHRYLLNVHEATYHTGIGLIQCPHCPFKTARGERYRNHIARHEKRKQLIEAGLMSDTDLNAKAKTPKKGSPKKKVKKIVSRKLDKTKSAKKLKSESKQKELSKDKKRCKRKKEFSILSSDPIQNQENLDRTVTDEQAKPENIIVYDSDNVLNYSCTLCGYITLDERTMMLHNLEHKYDRIMVCEFCSFSSDNKACMDIHLSNHNGVGKALCPFCEYSTGNKYHMKRHISEHRPPSANNASCDSNTTLPYNGTHHNTISPLGLYCDNTRDPQHHKLSSVYRQSIYLQTFGNIVDGVR